MLLAHGVFFLKFQLEIETARCPELIFLIKTHFEFHEVCKLMYLKKTLFY